MTLNKKIIAIAFSISLAALLAIAFILPTIVKNKTIEAIRLETGRVVSIQEISINPLTLSAEIQRFALKKASGGGDQIAFKSVKTSISLASLFKGALVLSELSVTKPSISFTRTAPHSYDFNDILELQAKKPKVEKKGNFQFSISDIKIVDGSIDFDDLAVPGGKKHTVKNMELTVPVISNIPHLVETATAPHFSAVINGTPFKISGTTKPFSKSLETTLRIDMKDLNIPEYLGYVPTPLPIKLASGKVSLDGDIVYRVSKDKKPELQMRGSAQLNDFIINMKNGQTLAKLPGLEIKAANIDPLNQNYQLDAINFESIELFINRAKSGQWNFQTLLPKTAKTGSTEIKSADKNSSTKKTAPSKPTVKVASFGVHNATLHFRDAVPAKQFSSDINQIDLDVTGFSSQEGTSADYELSLLLDNISSFNIDGSFSQKPLKATASASIDNLQLEGFYPYYGTVLTAPLKGSISCSADAEYDDKGAIISNLTVALSKLSTIYGEKEKLDLASFVLKDGSFNQTQNRFNAGSIKLAGGNIPVSKERDGSLSILTLLQKQKGKSDSSATESQPVKKTTAVAGKTTTGKELSWKIGKLELQRLTTTFTDKSRSDKPQFSLNNTDIAISNLQGPIFTPAGFQFSSTFNKATPFSAKGVLTPQPFRYKGSVNIGRLPIRDFESYFPENVNVFIVAGNAETSMNVDISLKEGKPYGSYKGSAALRAFHAVDTKAEEDLLKWESLQLDDIQGTLEPFTLALHEIVLNSVYSRIIIRKDGTLNLQNLVEKQENKAAAATGQEAVVKPETPEKNQTQPKKQVRIDAVTIQDGTLAFTDTHLPQLFETTFFNLGGRVSGLSSDDAQFADVDLRGNLENHSPLLISGKINPLRGDLFVDLKVSFKDIELSPITPYTATFLGYPVEKGKLFLDLKYLIDKKKLDSENKVFIDQFTLGEKVESDKATSLPVKLGLALLKDRKGEIHLDLPVTGRTDDPKFSIWGVVWQVVKNVLVKAVTSPFSLLSSMFGGSGEDFSSIQFAQGSSALTAQEAQKLTTLAKALLDRPALKMELKGYVDRERDTEGYRAELLNRKVKNEKILASSAKGTVITPDKIESFEVTAAEYPELLKAVYKKEKFPKPRNAIGFVKDLPPDEMKKLIIANTIIGDQELQTLAHERVVAVFNYLIKKGNVPIERIFQKNDDLFKKPAKENNIKSRVEINALAQ